MGKCNSTAMNHGEVPVIYPSRTALVEVVLADACIPLKMKMRMHKKAFVM